MIDAEQQHKALRSLSHNPRLVVNQDVRETREAFVSGLSGSSISEIVFIECALLAAYAFHSSVARVGGKGLLAAFSLVLPVIVVIVFPGGIFHLNVLTFVIFLSTAIVRLFFPPVIQPPISSVSKGYVTHLTSLRSMLLLVTCMAILAVDFPIFPRRHAKTELFGISLMDSGVGSTVFTNGMVLGSKPGSYRSTLLRGGLLLFLGIARPLLLRMTNYQLHVSEYGTDWNFFLTLAILLLGYGSLVLIIPNVHKIPLILGTCFTVAHILSLSFLRTQDYIVNEPRKNFVSNNKEGLLTLPGYAALFFFGAAARRYLISRKSNPWLLFFYSSILYIMLHNLWEAGHKPSRRLVNLEYIIFILMFSFFFDAGIILVDFFVGLASPTKFVRSFGENQLVVFICANLMTGIVNILFDPGVTSGVYSFGILSAYIIFLYIFAIIFKEIRKIIITSF